MQSITVLKPTGLYSYSLMLPFTALLLLPRSRRNVFWRSLLQNDKAGGMPVNTFAFSYYLSFDRRNRSRVFRKRIKPAVACFMNWTLVNIL